MFFLNAAAVLLKAMFILFTIGIKTKATFAQLILSISFLWHPKKSKKLTPLLLMRL